MNLAVSSNLVMIVDLMFVITTRPNKISLVGVVVATIKGGKLEKYIKYCYLTSSGERIPASLRSILFLTGTNNGAAIVIHIVRVENMFLNTYLLNVGFVLSQVTIVTHKKRELKALFFLNLTNSKGKIHPF